ncbi:HRDC domain-containing protein [Flavobacterium sp.]|jgi:superfamily II DNA helicase RecQ|uniref:HRDC domain-containing protein n=1 Tax=Flavobacterium sp. TaxID=239 RepID=UPI0037BF398E
MNIKHFRVRVSGEHLQNDQNAINQFLNEVVVKKTATNFIAGMIDYWSVLVFFEPKISESKESKEEEKVTVSSFEELSSAERNTLNSLKNWRSEKSNKLGLPQYMICHNSELMTIAKVKPESVDELKKIKGFGEQKISRYGTDIISLLRAS